jgi:hypothetical protein
MPINNSLDVLIQEEDLVVLGPPRIVDVSVDIGRQGEPGSQIYVGNFDPNSITDAQFTSLYGAAPQINDVFLRNEEGQYYGIFYSYLIVPGGPQWEIVLGLQESFNQSISELQSLVTMATSASTVNIAIGNGATASSLTKTMNIGTGGQASSTTNINIGSATSGALGRVRINQDFELVKSSLKLNASVSGAPSLDAFLNVERGTSPDVSIRWNETIDEWQFTNNGSSYTSLGSESGFLNHFLIMGG